MKLAAFYLFVIKISILSDVCHPNHKKSHRRDLLANTSFNKKNYLRILISLKCNRLTKEHGKQNKKVCFKNKKTQSKILSC